MKPEKITTHGLLEVCELISGTRTKVTDGPYFIYGAGMKAKGTTDKFNCESDTIRLTRKGTVGAVYFHRDPFWIDGDSFRVEPKEMIDKRYLFHWLLMKREEIERCADGDNQPGLSLARLSKIRIDVPDMEYQLKVVKLLDVCTEKSVWDNLFDCIENCSVFLQGNIYENPELLEVI